MSSSGQAPGGPVQGGGKWQEGRQSLSRRRGVQGQERGAAGAGVVGSGGQGPPGPATPARHV
jgi:hypothetical protein